MGRILGIDLGTSYSCVAVIEGRAARMVPNDLGQRLTPSVVRLMRDGPPIVGEAARRARISDAANTITGIKRLLGRRYHEVPDLLQRVAYRIVPGLQGQAMIEAHGRRYSPEELSSYILRSLKSAAEAHLGEPISEAVISVPAYFGNAQREAVREAGELAGLEIKVLVVEPAAASMVPALVDTDRDQTVAVFDLGGGTFDISIVEVGAKVAEVISLDGDGFLGGDNFDESIVRWILETLREESGVDLYGDRTAMQRLREAAETAKVDLSQMQETTLHLPFLGRVHGQPLHFARRLSRSLFQELCAELIERLKPPCDRALQAAGKKPKDIDRVLLVGGATRIPSVREAVRQIFGKTPSSLVNPDEAVCMGTAARAGTMEGTVKDMLLLDVTPHALGVELANGSMDCFIPAGTTVPTKKTESYTTLIDGQDSVEVHVLEGQKAWARDNRSLARVALYGLPAAPRGRVEIKVTFDIAWDYRCVVTVQELSSGRTISHHIRRNLA